MLTLPIGADLALARLGAAILLSLVFGLVRQRSGKPIGFGTFTFVSVGACALALVAVRLAPDAPLALLGAIVTGVGFLGAGALVRSGAPERISGFTSAATIWIVAVFGLTIGVGEYLLAALLYAAIWLVTSIDLFMERRGRGVHRRLLTLTLEPEGSLDRVREVLGATLTTEIESLAKDADTGLRRVVVSVAGSPAQLEELLGRIESSGTFRGYQID